MSYDSVKRHLAQTEVLLGRVVCAEKGGKPASPDARDVYRRVAECLSEAFSEAGAALLALSHEKHGGAVVSGSNLTRPAITPTLEGLREGVKGVEKVLARGGLSARQNLRGEGVLPPLRRAQDLLHRLF